MCVQHNHVPPSSVSLRSPEADPKVKVRILHPHFQVFFTIILGMHCFYRVKQNIAPTFSEFFSNSRLLGQPLASAARLKRVFFVFAEVCIVYQCVHPFQLRQPSTGEVQMNLTRFDNQFTANILFLAYPIFFYHSKPMFISRRNGNLI